MSGLLSCPERQLPLQKDGKLTFVQLTAPKAAFGLNRHRALRQESRGKRTSVGDVPNARCGPCHDRPAAPALPEPLRERLLDRKCLLKP